MPVFTFEKIQPPAPARAAPITAAPKKRGNVIVRIVDRLSGARVKPTLRRDSAGPRKPKASGEG